MALVIADYADCRALTGGLRAFEVEAATVRELLHRIESRFPGLGDLIDQPKANAQNDESLLVEVRALLEPLAQAWQEIRPEVSGKATGTARRG